MKLNFQKIGNLFHRFGLALSAAPRVGGLEISDSALKFMREEKEGWRRESLPLPPGVLVGGELKDRDGLLGILKELRLQVEGKRSGRGPRTGVVVSLSSLELYTHLFTLPPLQGDKFEQAVELNMKMVSPADPSEVYSGWQKVGTSSSEGIEILAAFAKRDVVNNIREVLEESGFLVVAMEPRCLSTARVLRTTSGNFQEDVPAIFIGLDASGLDICIIRKGYMNFDYFHSWGELQGENKTLSVDEFRTLVARNVTQVMNFYESRFNKEPLGGFFFAATALGEEVRASLTENWGDRMWVREIAPRVSPPLPHAWLFAFGAALRGATPRRKDGELSISGVDAREEFRREQVTSFTRFWRTVVPSVAVVVILIFTGALVFLKQVRENLEESLAASSSAPQNGDVVELQGQANRFNRSVLLLTRLAGEETPIAPVLRVLQGFADSVNIRLTGMSLVGDGKSSFSGVAASEEDVVRFKEALESDPRFIDVSLPLSAVQSGPEGYTFSISFGMQVSSTN